MLHPVLSRIIWSPLLCGLKILAILGRKWEVVLFSWIVEFSIYDLFLVHQLVAINYRSSKNPEDPTKNSRLSTSIIDLTRHFRLTVPCSGGSSLVFLWRKNMQTTKMSLLLPRPAQKRGNEWLLMTIFNWCSCKLKGNALRFKMPVCKLPGFSTTETHSCTLFPPNTRILQWCW